MTARQTAAARPAASSTAWGRFLDHAMNCADCRTGPRCPAGDALHRAVQEVVAAAAP